MFPDYTFETWKKIIAKIRKETDGKRKEELEQIVNDFKSLSSIKKFVISRGGSPDCEYLHYRYKAAKEILDGTFSWTNYDIERRIANRRKKRKQRFANNPNNPNNRIDKKYSTVIEIATYLVAALAFSAFIYTVPLTLTGELNPAKMPHTYNQKTDAKKKNKEKYNSLLDQIILKASGDDGYISRTEEVEVVRKLGYSEPISQDERFGIYYDGNNEKLYLRRSGGFSLDARSRLTTKWEIDDKNIEDYLENNSKNHLENNIRNK